MKIAVISDVHIGLSESSGGILRNGNERPPRIPVQFADFCRRSGEYAFIVQLGDLIQEIDRQTDEMNMRLGVELLSRCGARVHHVLGNHDTVHISADELRAFLGVKSLWYSFDQNGFHFVILYSHVPSPQHSPITIPDEELRWLESDLAGASYLSLLFVHHSLADQDLTGNPWFEGRPADCLIANRCDVRAVLSRSRKVIGVVNGHLHWNHFDIHDDIAYITIQSPIENVKSRDVLTESWGVIDLNLERLTVNVLGNDPATYQHRLAGI